MLSPLQWYVCKRDSRRVLLVLDHTAIVATTAFSMAEGRSFGFIFQVTGLLKCFTSYEEENTVKLLIVKGKGRAFCAGGDVAEVAQSINNDTWKYGADFFHTEFLLNYIIATYSKPQVSLLTGIVMGGGAGVSIHGRFRVATGNTVFAMPETALGLFPDIGASYFLSRLPGFYGDLFFLPPSLFK
uniref:3-hydroxyisobutyryl-CoA hydrolase n=1 Tax=Triticum urartu TaxID=4572 RepID=A0A8R7K016_TRIUA